MMMDGPPSAVMMDDPSAEILLTRKSPRFRLVVDLDQTVIHSEPVVSRKDTATPIAKLNNVLCPGDTRDLLIRPDLFAFFEHVSRRFDLQCRTNGTIGYAKQVLNCIDPESKWFVLPTVSRRYACCDGHRHVDMDPPPVGPKEVKESVQQQQQQQPQQQHCLAWKTIGDLNTGDDVFYTESDRDFWSPEEYEQQQQQREEDEKKATYDEKYTLIVDDRAEAWERGAWNRLILVPPFRGCNKDNTLKNIASLLDRVCEAYDKSQDLDLSVCLLKVIAGELKGIQMKFCSAPTTRNEAALAGPEMSYFFGRCRQMGATLLPHHPFTASASSTATSSSASVSTVSGPVSHVLHYGDCFHHRRDNKSNTGNCLSINAAVELANESASAMHVGMNWMIHSVYHLTRSPEWRFVLGDSPSLDVLPFDETFSRQMGYIIPRLRTWKEEEQSRRINVLSCRRLFEKEQLILDKVDK